MQGISVEPIDRPDDGPVFQRKANVSGFFSSTDARGFVPIPLIDISIAQNDLGFGIGGDQLGRKQSGGEVGNGLWAGLAVVTGEAGSC